MKELRHAQVHILNMRSSSLGISISLIFETVDDLIEQVDKIVLENKWTKVSVTVLDEDQFDDDELLELDINFIDII